VHHRSATGEIFVPEPDSLECRYWPLARFPPTNGQDFSAQVERGRRPHLSALSFWASFSAANSGWNRKLEALLPSGLGVGSLFRCTMPMPIVSSRQPRRKIPNSAEERMQKGRTSSSHSDIIYDFSASTMYDVQDGPAV